MPGAVRSMSPTLAVFPNGIRATQWKQEAETERSVHNILQRQMRKQVSEVRLERAGRRDALHTLVSSHASAHTRVHAHTHTSNCYQHPSKHEHYSYKNLESIRNSRSIFTRINRNWKLHGISSAKERKLVSLTQD